MSTTRRTAGVYSRKRPLGPNGEKICYNCGEPLPKGRPFNCSPECSEEWQCRTSPSYMRQKLQARDKGVCALCGVDTIALNREFTKLPFDRDTRQKFLKDHKIPYGRECTDWWDADHITPVIEGGGECGLENYRTLCIPCHKRVTAELAARRAEGRKKRKVVERDDARGLFADL